MERPNELKALRHPTKGERGAGGTNDKEKGAGAREHLRGRGKGNRGTRRKTTGKALGQ